MPALITHKEFERISKEKRPEIKTPVVSHKEIIEEKVQKEYYYLYPDNVTDRWYNGKYIVDCEGKRNELEIKSGIVKTSDNKISDCLRKQGFIFMYEKEAINE